MAAIEESSNEVKVDKFIRDIDTIIPSIDKLFNDHYIYPFDSVNDYLTGRMSSLKKRVINGIFIFLIFIMGVKCLLIATIDQKWIWLLSASSNHYSSSPVLNLIFMFVTFGIGFNMLTLQLFDPKISAKYAAILTAGVLELDGMTRDSRVSRKNLKALHRFRHIKYVWPFSVYMAVNICSFIFGLLFYDYIRGSYNVPLTFILLWAPLLYFSIYYMFLVFLCAMGVGLFAAFILRAKFHQIHDDLHELTHNRKYMVKERQTLFWKTNLSQLNAILTEHKQGSHYVFAMNELYKIKLAIYYHFIIPAIDLLFVMMISDSGIQLRLIVFVIFLYVDIPAILLNYALSTVSVSAHSPYTLLYSLLNHNFTNCPLKLKFQIRSMLESLSRSPIAFTCYDLFPFTKFNLYFFIATCVSFLFLILGFV